MALRKVKEDWLNLEEDLRQQSYLRVAGLDEAGCGPLAGPVVAACVILPSDALLPGLNDSKKLSEKVRSLLYPQIIACAEYGIGMASPEEIDRLNIRQATYLAMQRAVASLSVAPDYLLVDCWHLPFWQGAQQGIVRGDAQVRSIAAASVVAKVTRDRLMSDAALIYPVYQFARHKGYPTSLHYQLLRQYGACPLHRQSFLGRLQQTELNVDEAEDPESEG